jgi:hypothetical protein
VLGALFSVFSRSGSDIAAGLPPAFILGAAVELLGATVALVFIRRD